MREEKKEEFGRRIGRKKECVGIEQRKSRLFETGQMGFTRTVDRFRVLCSLTVGAHHMERLNRSMRQNVQALQICESTKRLFKIVRNVL